MMIYIKLSSTWGNLIAGINDDGSIAGLWFEGQKYFPQIPEDAEWLDLNDIRKSDPPENKGEALNEIYQTINELQDQFTAYESGVLKRFDLNLSPKGTVFQELVWQILLEIPYGKTMTYGEVSKLVAARLDRESMSAQAVGGAIGHNPISVIVPCHRVVGTKGNLTGYAGGLDKKSSLLVHEGVKCI